ncbi:MAG: putative membrane protein [Phormidesmis priestleyi Ana]|uniref:Putative membrane protein n=1 Tax=Phormidesmis priestleyi Ana TaxID=1666911 RepID=A0A0P7ZVM2_9CYAN|nr:MAG: putative membrane protein [Phormidesmis priestleyi Ana]
MKKSKRRAASLRHEANDWVRGLCGGFLFGVPLLYTMEVWWIGASVSPLRLLLTFLATLGVVYLLSRTEGFRKVQATHEREALGDTVEAVAIGLLSAALMLVVLQQVTLSSRLSAAVGKIVLESVPFSLGVALSNQFLSDAEDTDDSEAAKPTLSKRFFPDNNLNETIADGGATLVGALVVAFSIAPTDEVTVLVATAQSPWIIVMVMISLLLSYGIVFQANFTRQGQRRLQQGLFQSPLSETLFSYLVSLLAAALMLLFFEKIDFSRSWELTFYQILILGLPATIGGAAGRLAL